MHTNFFIDFAIITGLTTIVGFILNKLSQPLVAAYLLVGIAISFFQIGGIQLHGPLEYLPEVGIAFLLFMIGLELDLSQMKLMGKPMILAGLVQVTFTTALVALAFNILHFSVAESVLLGLAISFSSTIVVIKLLIDKHEMATLHGRLALGMLLLEDLVAIIALMVIAFLNETAAGFGSELPTIGLFVAKGLLLAGLVFLLIRWGSKRIFGQLAQNHELLFLGAIFWCFLFIMLAVWLGFSLEIGAFLGGLTLASSPYRFQIAGRLKPLRDFFIAIFFISLGIGVTFVTIKQNIVLLIGICILAFFIKPLIVMAILSLLKFRKYTVYHVAASLSQISEFSVVMLVAAQRAGLVHDHLVSVVAFATIVTIFISAIAMNHSPQLYLIFRRLLGLIERKGGGILPKEHEELRDKKIIVVGAEETTDTVVKRLMEETPTDVVVVDYNPGVVQRLQELKVPVLFGDISDPDILDQLNIAEAKLIITTILQLKANLVLLEAAKSTGSHAHFIIAAVDETEEKVLRARGAQDVVIPLHLEGERIVQLVEKKLPHIAA